MEKVIIVIIFLSILASLFSALFYMVKDRGENSRTLKALSFRIGISVGLFILLLVLWKLGIIEPHGIQP
ncbi:MAG: hypothetical protein CMO26_15555 [Thiotrichales bacterium]|nr:hypothetical protein [Thiotrichales bacterium]